MDELWLVTDARPHAADVVQELAPLLEGFRRRGVTVRCAGWDDPTIDWASAPRALLRTPWNYHRHVDAFLQFCDRVPLLHNPAPVVRWNARKTYLADLERAGFPTVPTLWLDTERDLDGLLVERGWAEAVLKPTVSAGSFRTRRFRRGQAPQELLREILRECPAMLQPYLAAVETTGERSLVYFAGAFSHAVKRHPPLETGLHGGPPVTPEPDELDLARRLLATKPGLLYARVDVARDGAGEVRLMELELIEPSLFLDTAPGAADRFVEAACALD